MKIFLLFAVALSLVSCGGGGGYAVTEQSSDCPLCKAAKEGDLDQVEIFLSGGMNPNSVSSSVNAFPGQTERLGILNDSALRFAVAANRADIVRVLIDAGADVNKANKNGSTPITAASDFSSGEITKILLDSGANPNAANKLGGTALMNAVSRGYLKVIEMLLDGGVNPNAVDKDGVTALMVAAEYGRLKAAEVLLARGANPNMADKESNTILMVAIFEGYAKIVKVLLDGGANPNTVTKDGWTPLADVAWTGNAEIAKVLLDGGANPNMVTKDGWTPINIAANKGQVEVAKVLLDCGASPDTRNDEGANVWDWVNEQPVMHAIFNRYLAKVKAGKVIKSCPHEEVAVAAKLPKGKNFAESGADNPCYERKAECLKYIRKSAEQGNVYSQYNLGLMYSNGEGVVTDKREALRWYRLAAEQGDSTAQYNLGVMYAKGEGIVQDYIETYIWFLIAKASGEETADEKLQGISWQQYFTLAENKSAKREAARRFEVIENRKNNALYSDNNLAKKDGREFAIAKPPEETNIAAEVFENTWRSVVMIKNAEGQGSGVIIRPNLVATNCHVIEGGGIFVYKPENRRVNENSPFSAKIIYRKEEHDFCILEVKGLWGFPAKIRRYSALKIGENVYALGAPQGLDLSLSSGIISQLRQDSVKKFIQTDAAISPGSSGGGLFDSDGNLVGILTSKYVGEDVEGIGFAIPADLALEF